MKKILLNLLAAVLCLSLSGEILTFAPTPVLGDSLPELAAIQTGTSPVEAQPSAAAQNATPGNEPSIPANSSNSGSRSLSTQANPAPVKTPSGSSTSVSATTNKAAAIVATAKKYIGVPYLWGGTTPAGFDCSGYTQYVFAQHGIVLPRISRDQYTIGRSVSFANLQPGDLVFFSLAQNGSVDHVGIYVGNGQFINASSSKGVAVYSLGTYWTSRYLGAKRVL